MLIKKFIKFILVGILNTLFSYVFFAFFIFINMHYALAVLLASVIGVLFNFKTIGILVFQNGSNRLIFRFLGVYLVTYLLNVSALKACASFRINMYVAGLLVALPMAVISFLLLSRFVYLKAPVQRVATYLQASREE